MASLVIPSAQGTNAAPRPAPMRAPPGHLALMAAGPDPAPPLKAQLQNGRVRHGTLHRARPVRL
jgi:hypothetical protein